MPEQTILNKQFCSIHHVLLTTLFSFYFSSQILAFFLEDETREKRNNRFHGHVPSDFRHHYFYLSISGEQWVHKNQCNSTTTMYAKLFIKSPNSSVFEQLLVTESIQGEVNPTFIKRARFNPLKMVDSQNVAVSTIIRFDAFLNHALFFSMQFTLAELLWNLGVDSSLHTMCVSNKNEKKNPLSTGHVFLNVVRGRRYTEPVDAHVVQMKVTVQSEVWSKMTESKLQVAVSAMAEKGRWSRLYLSEGIRKHGGIDNDNTFQCISLKRETLACSNAKNPIRIELYVRQKACMKLLGFSQFVLGDVCEEKVLPWSLCYASKLAGHMSVQKWNTWQSVSEIYLMIKKDVRKGRMEMGSMSDMKVSEYVARTAEKMYWSWSSLCSRLGLEISAEGSNKLSLPGPKSGTGGGVVKSEKGADFPEYIVRFPEDFADDSSGDSSDGGDGGAI